MRMLPAAPAHQFRMKKHLLPLLVVLFTTLATTRAQFTLAETGGTFRANATNIAAASNAGVAIGQDELDYGIHYIVNINDGIYGNSNSWIGYADYGSTSWVGVILASTSNIGSFAFGRDNTGTYTSDRIDWAPYTIQYTQSVVTDQASANAASWLSIGALDYAANQPPSYGLRHLYNLDTPLTGVTAFRIVTTGGISNGNAIDELELYSSAAAIPEPSTYALIFGAGVLGLAAWRRRCAA
jgi:hypothetical protein